jgi:pantoate--beta-alanine ligase
MVRDMAIAVEIVGCPIVREPDGLATSSRNAYLAEKERKSALALYRSLQHMRSVYDCGERDPLKLRDAGFKVLIADPGVRLDYVEAVDAETLEPVDTLRQGTLVAVAAWVGSTRLIDNVLLP